MAQEPGSSAAYWVDDPNAPNNGPMTNGVVWGLQALSTIFLGLRLFCKIRKSKSLRLDDWVLVAAWASLLAHSTLISVVISQGYGKPFVNVNPAELQSMWLRFFVLGTLLSCGMAWTKTSFAISLLAIAGPRTTVVLYFIIITVNVFIMAATVMQWLQCSPPSKAWTPALPGHCWVPEISLGLTLAAAAYSAFMNMVLALLPWSIIMRLQMNQKEKIGIAVAMSMGIFSSIAGIVKCAKLPILKSEDFSYMGGELTIWSVAEIATALVASSIPVLRTLVVDIRRSRPPRARSHFQVTSHDDMNKDFRIYRSGINMITVAASGRASPEDDIDSRDWTAADDNASGRIMKTAEVQVKFDRNGREFSGRDSGIEESRSSVPYRPPTP